MVRIIARLYLIAICMLCATDQPRAEAGMPSPLPTDYERVTRLTDTAYGRLEAISFFAAAVLLSAAVVRWLWNVLQKDFPKLPPLTYAKALAGVFLWGLLFVIVLTMISGARELLTPGAWKKEGATYKLGSTGQSSPTDAEPERKRHLELLKTDLWQYAATHAGQFPSSTDGSEISPVRWEVPDGGGLRYLYVAGLSTSQPPTLLAYEPELDRARRFALLTNGEIVCPGSPEIDQLAKRESRP